jgi:hypothetical protein
VLHLTLPLVFNLLAVQLGDLCILCPNVLTSFSVCVLGILWRIIRKHGDMTTGGGLVRKVSTYTWARNGHHEAAGDGV